MVVLPRVPALCVVGDVFIRRRLFVYVAPRRCAVRSGCFRLYGVVFAVDVLLVCRTEIVHMHTRLLPSTEILNAEVMAEPTNALFFILAIESVVLVLLVVRSAPWRRRGGEWRWMAVCIPG